MSARRAAAALALALAAPAALVALADPSPASLLRHAYALPVIAGALRFGLPGGGLAAAGAVLLHAPFVLPAVERDGLRGAAGEGLVTLGLLLLVGLLGGALKTRALRQRRRYDTLLAAQRALADEPPLDIALARLRAGLGRHLRPADVALVVRDGARLAIAGGETVAAESATAAVLATGAPRFVADAGDGPRPRRVFVAPLVARGEVIGALAVERVGELDADERAALTALGAHVGLLLENARLAARQRRFADELSCKVASATERLEAMDRAKSAFVAVASHELRTPLTALRGFSELLVRRDYPPAEVRRLAAILHHETERLARIVDDFLDLSRLERGLAPPLRRGRVAVEAAIGAAVDLFRRASPTHRFVVECVPPLPPLDADPDAVERVLANLVSNAVKYSPPGSTVRVRAHALAAEAAVEIVVADDGRGIPAEALARVFEPYYRAPDAAEAAHGAGIGLAVVKALVEAHGGSITLTSAPATGTRVTVILPAVP